ncbi:MAG: SusC/RagA family TonB-linked outer membrane protein [Bacteroidetes bacterium]|nr:SusC/RagA family TonB-linked outer membrane protein [Bacteroidota bacterium]
MKESLRIQIRNVILVCIFLFCSSGLMAQNLEISGTITEVSTGMTIIGATVLEKGTMNGTVSDVNGKYKIKAPKGAILVFSYVGYQTKEVTIKEAGTIDVAMADEVNTLNELIVIGYSTQKKTDKTGAVSMVKSDELNGGVITDPIQGLQGKAAGVSVTKKGGDPSEPFYVRVRGASGYDANTQPLYVVDGIPNADPNMIAPDDIESFNILKDAASTAIYGSQGSNGVIIITTKKGSKSAKTKESKDDSYSNIEFTSQFSVEKIAKKLKVLSADEMRSFANTLLEAKRAANPDSTYTMSDVFLDGGASTDWQNEIYRIGYSVTNNLSISGGNKHGSYLGSVGQSNWDGIMKGTSKTRTTAHISLVHKAFNDHLTITGNMMGAIEKNKYQSYNGWGQDDIIYQALSRNPTDPVYNANGSYYKSSRVFNYENPISIIDQETNNRDAKYFLGGLRLDAEIIKGLVASVNTGYTRNDQTTNYFRPANLYQSADVGFGKKQYDNDVKKLIEITGNYTKSIKDAHNLNILLGYSWQQDIYSGFYAQGGDAQSPYAGPNNLATLNNVVYGDIGSWKGESTLIGFFGRAQYNYKSKYYVSGSLRRDGSSKFGSNNKWGWFPTAAIGWSMEKENFMKSLKWLDQLKIRGSYGVSGNDKIGNYRSLVLWEPSGRSINPETGQYVITYSPAWNANPNLKWEETTEYNIGLDFAVLNQRLSGTIELYSKRTTDLLGEYQVPVPPNLSQTTFANSGSLTNKGIEVTLQAYILSMKNLTWKSTLTLAHNQTKITDLGAYVDTSLRKMGYISARGLVGDQYYVTGIMVGQDIGAFYLPKYVGLKNGQFVYESNSGGYTTNLSEAKRTVIATPTPKLEIGWSNTFTIYKRWTVDFSFRAWLGNHIYNATRMLFDSPNILPDLNAVPEAIDWYAQGRTSGASIADIYVENASFVKLDFLQISYDFNVSKIKWINKFNLFIAANNVFTITGYKGVDPETNINGLSFGIDQYNVYPKTRSYTIGLKATF